MRVPTELVPILRKTERVFSHGTADRETAVRRHLAALTDWHDELDALRRAHEEPPASNKRIEFTAYRLAKDYFDSEVSARRGPLESKTVLGMRGVYNDRILDIEVELDQNLVSLINPEEDMMLGGGFPMQPACGRQTWL